jgi:inhibitor of cysteine peptidase
MRVWISLASLLLAAGCAPQSQTDTPGGETQVTRPEQPSASGEALPAPVEANIRTIGRDQAGQTFQVAVGERFAVALVGIPTAGYLWEVAELPAFLTRAGEGGGPTTQAQTQPGFVGGNHWETFYFAATTPGEATLTLVQRRSWETNEPPSNTFSVTIRAQ